MGPEDYIIDIKKLSKRYRIGLKEEMHDSFLATALDQLRKPLKNFRKYRSLYRFDDRESDGDSNTNNNTADTIWAIKDISLQIKRGERLGIIGSNGAGKTTLLKILSKITTPTSGRALIRGSISSLLEVGTGFHPELTGRENIYLNGAILGMRKKELDIKFDRIVSFSGVEKFIDTPVKRYSIGMKIRLGFSVAAHLEPEILVIDEVLAVGDIDFQKKCLNKMESVGDEGRTVLFVSHNMQAITRLCTRAVLLENGQIKNDGPADKVVASYINSGTGIVSPSERIWKSVGGRPGGEIARLIAVRIKNESGEVKQSFDISKPIGIEMEYELLKSDHLLMPHHNVFNEEGVWIFTTIDTDPNWRSRRRPAGKYKATAWIPGNLLSEGIIYVNTLLFTLEPRSIQFDEKDVVSFQVIDNIDGKTARVDWAENLVGAVRPYLKWVNEYEKL